MNANNGMQNWKKFKLDVSTNCKNFDYYYSDLFSSHVYLCACKDGNRRCNHGYRRCNHGAWTCPCYSKMNEEKNTTATTNYQITMMLSTRNNHSQGTLLHRKALLWNKKKDALQIGKHIWITKRETNKKLSRVRENAQLFAILHTKGTFSVLREVHVYKFTKSAEWSELFAIANYIRRMWYNNTHQLAIHA